MLEIPQEYVIGKFYELGYQVKHLKYNDTYNGKCPICREGKSFSRKRRCFYIPAKNLIYCHNCGWSSQPYNWIKQVSGMSDAELMKEISACDCSVGIRLDEPEVEKIVEVPTLPEDSINLCDPTQVKYYKSNNIVIEACKVIRDRRLDTAVNRPRTLYVSLRDKVHRHRLIIPFFDQSGDINFYQSRRIFAFDKKEKYISKLNGERSVFNLDRVTSELDDVFIFEGPLDSFFTRNGIAVGGITEGRQLLSPKQEEQASTTLLMFNRIWVLDSQWLDRTARNKTLQLLKQKQSVFIWPENIGRRFKDFNEMCVALKLDEISPEFIKKHTFTGNEGVLKLAEVARSLN